MTSGLWLPSPGGYQRAYSESYSLAFDRLAKADLDEVCRDTGAVRCSDGSLSLTFLGDEMVVDVDRRTVASASGTLSMTDQLVILHYLVTSGGKAPSGKLVSFKELPDGTVYYPTFYRRAIAPVVKHFGDSPKDLVAAAAAMGGEPVSLGDAAVAIQALPRVTLTWVLWRGDDDFPAEGSVLFDSTIVDYLPIEDIAALCQSITLKLTGKSTH